MENNITRIYKTTEAHRKGNMTKELFVKDFSFDKVTFSENLSDKERQESLNAAYDALYDLSEVLDVSPYILTLRDNKFEEKCIHIGQKSGNSKYLFVDVNGLVAYNWFKYLDNYLGDLNGFVDGYIANLSKVSSEDSFAWLFKKLISVMKYKEVSLDNSAFNDRVKGNINEILEVLDNMPIFKEISPDEYNNLETSRDNFIRELTSESYQLMKKLFARYNFFISNIDEAIIKKNLREIRNKRTEYSSLVHDLTKTDYFTLAKSLSSENSKYAKDIELAAYAFNQYIYYTMKSRIGINNHLCSSPEDVELFIKNQSEAYDIYDVFAKILDTVIPIISSNVVLTEVKVPEEDEESTENQIDDEELKKDKNKFKLTLFKKLLEEKGVKIAKTTTVSSQYCLTIDGSSISYLMAPINVYSTDKGQKVDVFVLENINNKVNNPYRWDYELNYEDLVDFIAKIHLSNKEKKVQESIKESENVFNIETFETACARHKLIIKSHKVVENDNKMYINNVITKNDFLHFYYDTSKGQLLKRVSTYTHYKSKENNRLVCSFVGVDGAINIEWVGRPNYDSLAKEISNKLQKVFDDSKAAINQARKEKEKEEQNIDNSLKLKEYTNPDGITTTDALRKRLVKYVNDRKDKPKYIITSHNYINILKSKACGNPDYAYYNGIVRGSIPDNEIKGNSKSWGVKDNVLIIINKSDDRKAIEGAIEATITKFIEGSKYSARNKKLVSEGLTYMFAKYYNLDVRTYCQSEMFEKLVSSEKETKEYLSAVIKLFNKFIYLMK